MVDDFGRPDKPDDSEERPVGGNAPQDVAQDSLVAPESQAGASSSHEVRNDRVIDREDMAREVETNGEDIRLGQDDESPESPM